MITLEQVHTILGHSRLSEHTLAEIIRLEPTEEEVLEALNRVVRGEGVGAETRHAPNAVVLKLCEILEADEAGFPGEEAEG